MISGFCANHPSVPAVATCARCGTFVCGGCVELVEEDAYCAPCLRTRGEGRPSSRARLTFALAVGELVLTLGFWLVSWTGALPFHALPAPVRALIAAVLLLVGPFAVGVGWLESRQVRRGRAPLSGLTLVRVAYLLAALGWFGALMLFAVLFLVR